MRISTKNFYRGALIFPILLPIILLPFDVGTISAILLLSLWFAGAPYLLFAIGALVWIGRTQHRERLGSVIWATPFVFLPFSVTGWLLHQWLERASNPNLVASAAELIPIAVFTVLVGYAYVLLAQFVLLVSRRMGVVE